MIVAAASTARLVRFGAALSSCPLLLSLAAGNARHLHFLHLDHAGQRQLRPRGYKSVWHHCLRALSTLAISSPASGSSSGVRAGPLSAVGRVFFSMVVIATAAGAHDARLLQNSPLMPLYLSRDRSEDRSRRTN